MLHRHTKLATAGLAAGLWPLTLLFLGNPTFNLHDFALVLPIVLGLLAALLGEKLQLRPLTLMAAAFVGGYLAVLPLPHPFTATRLRADNLHAMVCMLTVFSVVVSWLRPQWLVSFPALAEVFVTIGIFATAPRLFPDHSWIVQAWTYRVSVPAAVPASAALHWVNGFAVLAAGALFYRWFTAEKAGSVPILAGLVLGCFWVLEAAMLAGYEAAVPVEVFVSVPALCAVSFLVFGELFLYWQRIYVDELTGVLNRRALNERLWNLRPHFSRPHYTLAMIDIDHFKRFNDTFGHEQGDTVLRFVASHFKNPQHGTCYRYGGEEFCILFENISAPHAARILNQMREDLAKKNFHIRASKQVRQFTSKKDRKPTAKTSKTNITVSIGVAEPQADLQTADDVLKAADAALYRAKHLGRNRVVETNPSTTNFVAQLYKA